MSSVSSARVSILVAIMVAVVTIHAQEPQPSPPRRLSKSTELNTLLMKSTFLIEGEASARQIAYGTAFIIGRPLKRDDTRAAFVLVTAKHVLESIVSETA